MTTHALPAVVPVRPAASDPSPVSDAKDWPRREGHHHPLAFYVDAFLSEMAASRQTSANTVRHYGHDLALFLRYLQRHKPNIAQPSQLRPETIRDFLSHSAIARGNSRSSNRRRLAALRKFCGYLRKEGLMAVDPTRGFAITPNVKGPPTVLTRDEALRLLEASKMSRFPFRDHAIFRLFLTCGCTLSELLGLEPSHYSPSDGTIAFTGRRQATRQLVLAPSCRRALDDYMERRPMGPGTRLFLNRRGENITKGAVYHAFQLAVQRAGVQKEGLTIHSLRHTCIALMWRAGVSLHVLQEVAGHRSLATTRDYAWAGPRKSVVGAWRRRHPLED